MKTEREDAAHKPKRDASGRADLLPPRSRTPSPPPELWETEFCCLSHSACRALSRQPWQRKTTLLFTNSAEMYWIYVCQKSHSTRCFWHRCEPDSPCSHWIPRLMGEKQRKSSKLFSVLHAIVQGSWRSRGLMVMGTSPCRDYGEKASRVTTAWAKTQRTSKCMESVEGERMGREGIPGREERIDTATVSRHSTVRALCAHKILEGKGKGQLDKHPACHVCDLWFNPRGHGALPTSHYPHFGPDNSLLWEEKN